MIVDDREDKQEQSIVEDKGIITDISNRFCDYLDQCSKPQKLINHNERLTQEIEIQLSDIYYQKKRLKDYDNI